jgi:hypothetical protein
MTEKKPKPLSLKIKRTPLTLKRSASPASPSIKRPLSLGVKKQRLIIKKSPPADISRTFVDAESQPQRTDTIPTPRRVLKKKRRIINTNLGKHYTKKKPAWKKKPAPPKKPASTQPKKIPPSKIKAQQLESLLTERFDAWRTHQPLQLGVEKQIFQLIGKEHLPYSKRVVQKVLSRHTSRREYLENTLRMNIRVSLKNEMAGEIQDKDKVYAKSKVVVK